MHEESGKWRSEVIDTDDRFFAMQEEWNDFQQALDESRSSPFLGWDWLYLWWSVYRRPRWRLSIAVLRYDNRIVAIFPFYIKSLIVRQLFFLGTGESEHEEVATEYLDCLIAADPDVMRYSGKWFKSFLRTIDIVVFERMFESATILLLLSEIHEFSLSQTIRCGRQYCLKLQDDFAFGENFSSNLKRKYRKFKGDRDSIGWQFELCNSVSDLDASFFHLKRLHELRWRMKGKPGAFSSWRFCRFHRAFAESMLQKNRLYLGMLSVKNEIVGCLYAIDGRSVRYFYQAGFAPAVKQWAPGHIGHFVAIDDAFSKGYMAYDFMLGSEIGSYKREYVEPGELLVTTILARSRWQMALYRFLNKFFGFLI